MKEFSYGQLCLAFLLISIISGFIVGYHYEVALPLISTVSIDALLPYGWFWRSIHFWSSQVYVLLICLHIFDLRSTGYESNLKRIKIHWSIVAITLPLSIFVLFSGYVLRYDATGQAAGAICENLLLKVPIFGKVLNRLFFDITAQGLNRIYIVHIFIGFICWLIATWYHLKRVRLFLSPFLFTMFFILIFCSFIKAPIDNPTLTAHLIKGPWFFLGIQELLRYFNPLIAGILFPLIPVILVAIMPWVKNRKYLYLLFLFWGISYFGVSFMSVLRAN